MAIGPYYHRLDQLKPTEKVKHAAAYSCARDSRHTVEELVQAVFSVAEDACRLYDKDHPSLAGISNDEFVSIFLLRYMHVMVHSAKPGGRLLDSFINLQQGKRNIS